MFRVVRGRLNNRIHNSEITVEAHHGQVEAGWGIDIQNQT